MTDLREDVVVHVDLAKHRLVMTSLGKDVIVHLDSAKHRLVMIDLGEDVIVHVDYAGHDRLRRRRHHSRRLSRTFDCS